MAPAKEDPARRAAAGLPGESSFRGEGHPNSPYQATDQAPHPAAEMRPRYLAARLHALGYFIDEIGGADIRVPANPDCRAKWPNLPAAEDGVGSSKRGARYEYSNIDESQTALSTLVNEWTKFERSLAARPYVGLITLFKKGNWICGTGDQQKDIALGTTAIATVPSSQVGWQRFENGIPGSHIFVPVTQRLQLPTRRALGDNDSSLWEVGEDGRARDPWQYMFNMVLIINSEVCTFCPNHEGCVGSQSATPASRFSTSSGTSPLAP